MSQRITSALLIAMCLLVASVSGRVAGAQSDALRITLRPQASVAQRLVCVGDVADLNGGTAAERARVAALDLVQLQPGASHARVTRTFVQARLLLSNAAPANCVVDGAPASEVSLQSRQAAEGLAVNAARHAVAQRLSLAPEDLSVELAQPLSEENIQLVSATAADDLRARVATAAGGRTRVELWTRNRDGQQQVTPISIEVRFRERVPVASRPLAARQTVAEGDILLEERTVSQRGVWLTADQIVGKVLRRPIAAGEILLERDLIAPVVTDGPILVKPRDLVRLTARKGHLLLVVPGAEALQQGRRGELIRVRNTASGRVVLGRVVDVGEVEVPL